MAFLAVVRNASIASLPSKNAVLQCDGDIIKCLTKIVRHRFHVGNLYPQLFDCFHLFQLIKCLLRKNRTIRFD